MLSQPDGTAKIEGRNNGSITSLVFTGHFVKPTITLVSTKLQMKLNKLLQMYNSSERPSRCALCNSLPTS